MWKFFLDDRIGEDGVSLWFHSGELVEVDGVSYVRDKYGVMTPAKDRQWYSTEEAARAAAAERIAKYVHALSAQYAKLREPANAVA